MIKAHIHERPDRNFCKIIVLLDENNVYDFVRRKWNKVESFHELKEDCQLFLSPDCYTAIARAIEQDKSLPKTQLSFVEGKLEAIETHLGDMRKLVFKERNKP